MKMVTAWTMSMMLLMMFLLIIKEVKKKTYNQKEKETKFECGFNTMNMSHIPFSFQFFLIALLFLIFDIEIALVLSYPMEISLTSNITLISIFLSILSVGLVYEWQNGKINWSQ
uniref:NADH dehydrogenase subunit 3 n=1 Tax=Ceratozetella imperatoria TaxID=3127034 RepID=UPI00315CFBCE